LRPKSHFKELFILLSIIHNYPGQDRSPHIRKISINPYPGGITRLIEKNGIFNRKIPGGGDYMDAYCIFIRVQRMNKNLKKLIRGSSG
jgi:hypothetical protein